MLLMIKNFHNSIGYNMSEYGMIQVLDDANDKNDERGMRIGLPCCLIAGVVAMILG